MRRGATHWGLVVAGVLAAGGTAAQVNQGALDALTPKPATPAPAARPAQPRPESRPAQARPANETRSSQPQRQGQQSGQQAGKPATPPVPIPPRPPAVPVAPPPAAALPPPTVVPVPKPLPPPTIPVAADAPGEVAPVSGGVRATFGPDRADLSPATETALRSFARTLKDGTAPINVMAYAAGSPNDPSTPRRLSLARALAARAVLMNEGIVSTRIYVRALGIPSGDGPPNRVDVIVESARS